jgi:glycosyltransferase involved in cell wall biosynthesis
MNKISIITPSYNQGHFLEQTIDSVLSQNYANLEYIIIDGGSNDNSVEIIRKYQKHLHYWVSEKDTGQSDAINKGLKIASGEIINWLNSDDYYTPNALHTVADCFMDTTTLAVCGRSNIWKQNAVSVQSNGSDIYSSIEKTVGWARIDQPETFFRKSAIDKMGPLNQHLHYVMDKEWWIRFLLLFGTAHIKKTDALLVNFRIHEQSKTFKDATEFMQESMNVYYTLASTYSLDEAIVFKELFDGKIVDGCKFPLDKNPIIIKKIIHYFWFLQSSIFYAQNNYAAAKKYLPYIDTALLSTDDAKELNKLKTRIKLLPVFVKKIVNKKR